MDLDLKNCPFCGGPATRAGAAIRCASFACNASMSPRWTKDVIGKAKDHPTKMELAIRDTEDRWNRRSGQEKIATLIKALTTIEMMTATGEGLDPEETMRVHLLAGAGRAFNDPLAWHITPEDAAPAPGQQVWDHWPRWRSMLLDEGSIPGAAIKEMDEVFSTLRSLSEGK